MDDVMCLFLWGMKKICIFITWLDNFGTFLVLFRKFLGFFFGEFADISGKLLNFLRFLRVIICGYFLITVLEISGINVSEKFPEATGNFSLTLSEAKSNFRALEDATHLILTIWKRLLTIRQSSNTEYNTGNVRKCRNMRINRAGIPAFPEKIPEVTGIPEISGNFSGSMRNSGISRNSGNLRKLQSLVWTSVIKR